MEKSTYKVLAIVLLVILILENLFIGWGIYLVAEEENQFNECAYETCAGSTDAWVEDNVCYCYDYDELGELVISSKTYMK